MRLKNMDEKSEVRPVAVVDVHVDDVFDTVELSVTISEIQTDAYKQLITDLVCVLREHSIKIVRG